MTSLREYASAQVDKQEASGAPVKLSTYGATAAAGIVGVLTLLNPTFDAVFGNSTSPWLKVVVFSVVLIVWGAIMLADTLARKVPAQTVPAPKGDAVVTHEDIAVISKQLRAMQTEVDRLDAKVGEHVVPTPPPGVPFG